MYPLIPFIMREVSENYTFKGTKISIEKGTKVWVPTYGIQRDADVYPEPEKFDPERFNDDAVAARHPMAYLPFGDGPRNCIGKLIKISKRKENLRCTSKVSFTSKKKKKKKKSMNDFF